ncbi:ATP-binding protein [Robiginitalea sp. M366]|uniref:sensor histidine kinase n=1 Tax=Robiginitalea aestuariiviva TaxID=3036903 RepID=UPI00240D5514|nr:ATP-binding protein [Robiginitalea aestuariiviva]MDG1572478.1 ATP-binding protein [Robiginitalea aestuariiviva]
MNRLFPFYLQIGPEGNVLGMGKTMEKLGLVRVGDPFFQDFKVERPLDTQTLEAVRRQDSSLFILQSLKVDRIKFRGQMFPDETHIYFLGSPLINSFDDLRELGLGLNDFALHDNINQFLFTAQMHLSSLRDSREIASRLEKSNKDLQLKNSELQDFAHVISHDLKSPINLILGLMDLMRADMSEKKWDDFPFYIDTIEERANRMGQLIVGILKFSKIGLTAAEREAVDLNTMIRDIFSDIPKDEGLTIEIQEALPTLYGVRVLFRQLFTNLISNAVKYADRENGKVSIACKDLDQAYEFAVTDNGPGIPEGQHEKIFELFQTVPGQETPGSTGVGLAIVKKVVSYLNGSIRLDSRLGEGTTFYIQLPKGE